VNFVRVTISSMSYSVSAVSPEIGLGVFARRRIAAGEEIFREEPLAACQHAANRMGVVACAHCFGYFNAASQLAQVESVLGVGSGLGNLGVRCACGELYCSEGCRQAAFSSHHWAMCVANEADDSALVKFKTHALEVAGSGDTLVLAAMLLASLVAQSGGDLARLHALVSELLTFSHGRYSEIARAGENEDWEEWLTADTLGTSFNYIKESMQIKHALFVEVFRDFELFDRVLGIFERNNVDVNPRQPNPIGTLTSKQVKKLVARFMEEVWDEEEMSGTFEEGLEQSELPEFHGTGFFPTISRLNHSCDCNARLDYDGRQGFCVATQDIAEGSEIVISYLGRRTSELSTPERLEMLKDYGFTCACKRCKH